MFILGENKEHTVSLICSVCCCMAALPSSSLLNFWSPQERGPQHHIHPQQAHAVCGRSAEKEALHSACGALGKRIGGALQCTGGRIAFVIGQGSSVLPLVSLASCCCWIIN